jgi:7-cyano-7-deazaguanine synthase
LTIRSLVLLSGGLDSAVALYWAIDKGYSVETLTFDYHLRSNREVEACKKIARKAGVRNALVDLDFLREVQDSRKRIKNPLLLKAPSAYVPSRNLVFYAIASSFAEVMDAKYIVGGHNRDDVRFFPDASIDFFKLFNKTASSGRFSHSRTGKVILPLAGLSKAAVVKLGGKFNVPFEMTWSCYSSANRPCGTCPSCSLREKAFGEAGLDDPARAGT